MATTGSRSFGPELLSFLSDLKANNDRDWFAANKQRYEEYLLEPALAFIGDFAPRLEKLSPHFRADARPIGGSLFRIYRDTRFSKDKAPYKTNVGIRFRHERAKDAQAPSFYLHIGPDEAFAGGGIWHPSTKAATRVREAIVADPERWRNATRGDAFAKHFRLGGDSLKRVPSWADPEHAFANDLRRKDFFASTGLSADEVIAHGFVDRYAKVCGRVAPLVHFLCDALEVPYQQSENGMQFPTKIAIVLRDDLAVWQKTNVTAFLVSGIAGTVPEVVGEPYMDASSNEYLPMLVQPVLVYEADAARLRRAYERAMSRGVRPAIYTSELFTTDHDEANRSAVAQVRAEDLDLVGIAFRAERKTVDRIVDRLRFHP